MEPKGHSKKPAPSFSADCSAEPLNSVREQRKQRGARQVQESGDQLHVAVRSGSTGDDTKGLGPWKLGGVSTQAGKPGAQAGLGGDG